MLRGGSWINNDPRNLRSSNRNNNDPGERNNNIGFRVVCVVVGSAGRRQRSRKKNRQMPHGQNACAARAKRLPNRPIRAPRERGKDAARAVAGNGLPSGGRPRKSRPAARKERRFAIAGPNPSAERLAHRTRLGKDWRCARRVRSAITNRRSWGRAQAAAASRRSCARPRRFSRSQRQAAAG